MDTPAPDAPQNQLPPIPPAPSPTGAAILPKWVPAVASVLVAIAGAWAPFLPDHPTVAGKVIGAIIALGAALGIASQGVRR